MSLFDNRDLAEITHPDFAGERLIACYNPLLAEERSRKRPELLSATEKELERIVLATQRKKRPLRGKQNIGLRVGKVLNRFKMGKHFTVQITDDSFAYQRKQANIKKEESLDGIYVIRTNVSAEAMSPQQAVRNYKSLSGVERAFRSLKTVDLHVRPIFHRQPDRVRAHILLCTLAYYVEWHMRQDLAPLLFDDDDKQASSRQPNARPQLKPRPTASAPQTICQCTVFKLSSATSPPSSPTACSPRMPPLLRYPHPPHPSSTTRLRPSPHHHQALGDVVSNGIATVRSTPTNSNTCAQKGLELRVKIACNTLT